MRYKGSPSLSVCPMITRIIAIPFAKSIHVIRSFGVLRSFMNNMHLLSQYFRIAAQIISSCRVLH